MNCVVPSTSRAATASDPIPEALVGTIAEQLRNRVPGLSMAVVRGNRLEWARGFGFANLATHRLVDASSVYLWFSMTKIVTAVM